MIYRVHSTTHVRGGLAVTLMSNSMAIHMNKLKKLHRTLNSRSTSLCNVINIEIIFVEGN